MQYRLRVDEYIHGGTHRDSYGTADVENTTCLLCGADDPVKLYRERGELGIVCCRKCGLVYTNPRVREAEQNYFGDAALFYQEARLIFKDKKPHHRDRNYLYELKQIKKAKPSGRLLDIGTNMGFFLRKAVACGYQAEGVEPSPALAEIARKEFRLKIRNAFFSKNDFERKSFDVVTMIDVFEHVTRPLEMLENVREVLKDDGILCIKVPNGNYNRLKLNLALSFNRQGQHDLFNSYEHVAHYTPDTMKEMLRKGGFAIRRLIIPIPIHPPVWANLTGHYYQYPSPFILDWKRMLLRNVFYRAGRLEHLFGLKIRCAPDLMFIAGKRFG